MRPLLLGDGGCRRVSDDSLERQTGPRLFELLTYKEAGKTIFYTHPQVS